MFTGIIQATCNIVSIEKEVGLWRIGMAFDNSLRDRLKHGASVAHNGVCLTVSAVDEQAVYFDVMQETLAVTNLSHIAVGQVLNIERAMRYGDEVGGHILSGHVQTCAVLISRNATKENSTLRFEVSPQWMKYILPKGFIAIDGASLTLGGTGENWFEIHLIPETRQLTTLDTKSVGSEYNIEIDSQTQAIVDTVERVMAARLS